MSRTKAAFIGLGNMGYPMAGHLQKNDFDVTVFNRTAAKAEAWIAEHGGAMAPTPAEAAKGAAVVCTCVGNDDDLRSVTLAETGAVAGMDAGSVLIDHTTASATVAREIAKAAAKKGVGFLDAPVSGGQEGAEKGVLTVMVGGSDDDFVKGEPAVKCYARAVTLMGPVGAGQLTKMVNQIVCVGTIQALSEGLTFARKAGIDPHRVVDTISKGAAQSWQMDNRSGTMLAGKFDFGFAVEWMHKDLGIALAEAEAIGASVPATEMIERFYAEIMDKGGRRWDCTSLIRRLGDDWG